MKALNLADNFSYLDVDDNAVFDIIAAVREGIKFGVFTKLAAKFPFSLTEWSVFLHLSERTIQRYKKEKRTFDPIQSEKILEITLLYKKGVEVFGNTDRFNSWLEATNVALGNVKPKNLLDNTFGINLLKDELIRIEHGVLA